MFSCIKNGGMDSPRWKQGRSMKGSVPESSGHEQRSPVCHEPDEKRKTADHGGLSMCGTRSLFLSISILRRKPGDGYPAGNRPHLPTQRRKNPGLIRESYVISPPGWPSPYGRTRLQFVCACCAAHPGSPLVLRPYRIIFPQPETPYPEVFPAGR